LCYTAAFFCITLKNAENYQKRGLWKIKIKKFQKTIDKWKKLGYNGKLLNDGYISLIRRSEWVGELCLSHKKTAKTVNVMGIVTIHFARNTIWYVVVALVIS